MDSSAGEKYLGWWTAILLTVIVALVLLSVGLFKGTFRTFVPVTLASDRSGLIMDTGSKVRFRGVQVGRVGSVTAGAEQVSLQLELEPDAVQNLPINTSAQIRASTVFGAKYVDLIYPDDPAAARITAGSALQAVNVSTEVNTVFENLVLVLRQIDPAKLNATLSALAEGVRGKGGIIGQATSDANDVLLALNPRMETVRKDYRSLTRFSAAYSAAAQDILQSLSAVSTTSTTITTHATDLDALLLNTIGFSHSGTELLGPNKDNLVSAINILEPTTNLLMKYNPSYTCMLLGATWFLDNGGRHALGEGDGRTGILDSTFLLGDDEYKFPENLPVIRAKGGPGGKPGCGSLPDASKNYPVRQMVTDTGWGSGGGFRTNPGIGHPWYVNYFPVTRAVPEPPSIRGEGPPAPGPALVPGLPAQPVDPPPPPPTMSGAQP